MIEKMSLSDFQPHLGEEFTLRLEAHTEIPVELVDAGAWPARPAVTRTIGGRELSVRPDPFWLVFRGPSEPLLPQAMYTLLHPQLGALDDLFLVPCDRDDSGSFYHLSVG
jgi:hypothetical protein